MNDQSDSPQPRQRRAEKVARGAMSLTGREYIPLAAILGFWAISAVLIGHANTARLLSATVLLRAVMMLFNLSSNTALRRRVKSAPEVFRQSRRRALVMQAAVLALSMVAVAAIAFGLNAVGQPMLAMMLVAASVGIPARCYRGAEPEASSQYFRLASSISMLGLGGLTWALGGGPIAMALAYGMREWVATVIVVPFLPSRISRRALPDPLTFKEVAQITVVSSRKLLTYRLTKNILTIFGPFGNIAARTGRGLNMHSRLEPYIPHRRLGFALFALVTGGGALALVLLSKEPSSALLATALLQLCTIAVNVLALWKYLPTRDDPDLVVEDDDDD